jgi:hypothetical protein
MGLQYIRAKDLRIFCRALAQGLFQQRPQRSTKPVMSRDIEAHFGSMQNRMRQLVLHQLLENYLLPRARNLERCREPVGKLDDTVVEKGRPHLQRVGHADAVRLNQNIIWEIVLLVEPQVRVEVAAVSAQLTAKVCQNAVQGQGKLLGGQTLLFRIGKSSVPEDMATLS